MPTISRFYGIKIKMYYDEDHGHLHFHAQYAEDEIVFNAETLEVIVGEIPTAKRKLVEAWAEIHKKEIIDNARRIADGKKPKKIRPLK